MKLIREVADEKRKFKIFKLTSDQLQIKIWIITTSREKKILRALNYRQKVNLGCPFERDNKRQDFCLDYSASKLIIQGCKFLQLNLWVSASRELPVLGPS